MANHGLDKIWGVLSLVTYILSAATLAISKTMTTLEEVTLQSVVKFACGIKKIETQQFKF